MRECTLQDGKQKSDLKLPRCHSFLHNREAAIFKVPYNSGLTILIIFWENFIVVQSLKNESCKPKELNKYEHSSQHHLGLA